MSHVVDTTPFFGTTSQMSQNLHSDVVSAHHFPVVSRQMAHFRKEKDQMQSKRVPFYFIFRRKKIGARRWTAVNGVPKASTNKSTVPIHPSQARAATEVSTKRYEEPQQNNIPPSPPAYTLSHSPLFPFLSVPSLARAGRRQSQWRHCHGRRTPSASPRSSVLSSRAAAAVTSSRHRGGSDVFASRRRGADGQYPRVHRTCRHLVGPPR